MTIEHMPDGTKQYTDAQGVVTKHADLSSVLHYQQHGQRLAYDTPEGYQAPAAPGAPVDQNAPNAMDAFIERSRSQGVARARRTAGLE